MKLSENQIRNLCKTNQKELAQLLNNPSTDISTLSFGAEIITEELNDENFIEPILKQLLKHVHVVVREGALNGIMNFYFERKPSVDILDKLSFVSSNDPSAVLKEQAQDMLKEFQNIKL